MDDRERRINEPDDTVPGTTPEGTPVRDPLDRTPAGEPRRMSTTETNVVMENRGPGAVVWVIVVIVLVLAVLWLTGVFGGADTTPADEGPVVPVEDQVPPADTQDGAADTAPGAIDVTEPEDMELPDMTDPLDPPLAPDGMGDDVLDPDN